MSDGSDGHSAGQLLIMDLGSSNGTLVDNCALVPLVERELKANERLLLGNYVLKVQPAAISQYFSEVMPASAQPGTHSSLASAARSSERAVELCGSAALNIEPEHEEHAVSSSITELGREQQEEIASKPGCLPRVLTFQSRENAESSSKSLVVSKEDQNGEVLYTELGAAVGSSEGGRSAASNIAEVEVEMKGSKKFGLASILNLGSASDKSTGEPVRPTPSSAVIHPAYGADLVDSIVQQVLSSERDDKIATKVGAESSAKSSVIELGYSDSASEELLAAQNSEPDQPISLPLEHSQIKYQVITLEAGDTKKAPLLSEEVHTPVEPVAELQVQAQVLPVYESKDQESDVLLPEASNKMEKSLESQASGLSAASSIESSVQDPRELFTDIQGQTELDDQDQLNFEAIRVFKVDVAVKHRGQPLEGVSVQAGPFGKLRSDANGMAVFTDLPEDAHLTLKIERPGYVFEGVPTVLTVRDDCEIHLVAKRLLDLTVEIMHHGAPLAGVEVELVGRAPGESNDSGQVVFKDLVEGMPIQLKLQRSRYHIKLPTLPEILEDAQTVTAEAIKLVNVSGVVSYKNVPVAGASIISPELGSTTTDSSGRYTFSNIPEGTQYTIRVEKEGYRFVPRTGVAQIR